MELLNIFAMMGMVIDDILAILSVVGSAMLFVVSFSKAPMRRYGTIANWSIGGLVVGSLFQISMAITGTTPEMVGIVFRMTPMMANGLLGLSLLLLVGRWLIRRNRYAS
jgi:uncharacterized membrane protein